MSLRFDPRRLRHAQTGDAKPPAIQDGAPRPRGVERPPDRPSLETSRPPLHDTGRAGVSSATPRAGGASMSGDVRAHGPLTTPAKALDGPRLRTHFPHEVVVADNVWIPMSDGTKLAAKIWLPKGASSSPVSAVLEYLPYRKGDFLRVRDSSLAPYLAGHGFAVVRVDLRGTGDSDGILADEYLPLEQRDGREVLAWIAAQPWSNGKVGMRGISWGGFNGLQIAATRPPELRGVLAIGTTTDRYANDVHYWGGCVLAQEMLPWSAEMLAFNALPPDPDVVGARWRGMWKERMEKTPPYVEEWLRHQRRDAYWRHGSVGERFEDIEVPVWVGGGWADPGYVNAVPELLAGLSGARQGLIGPWGHSFPCNASVGPSVGFLQEEISWWGQVLDGAPPAAASEPMLRAWIHDREAPGGGRWVSEHSWPSPRVLPRFLTLHADGGLDARPGTETALIHTSPADTGAAAGGWAMSDDALDLPPDQRADDARSLSFTSPPYAEGMTVLGAPAASLRLAADQPEGLVAVRLCDVAPDGTSTLVTRGVLNLTRRDSHASPTSLDPGRRYTVRVPLNNVGYRLPAGHSWRLSVSTSYWPMVWPSPRPVTLTLQAGASRLELPEYNPSGAAPSFEPPEIAAPEATAILRDSARRRRTVTRAGRTRLIDERDGGRLRLAHGLELDSTCTEVFEIKADDPLSAAVRCDWRVEMQRGDWRVRVETASRMTGDAERFYLVNSLTAYESDAVVFTKEWRCEVDRDLL